MVEAEVAKVEAMAESLLQMKLAEVLLVNLVYPKCCAWEKV